MYEAFYELRKRPFHTAPDPQFLFWSEEHVLGYTMLHYGIMMRAQITVVTGEIGSGKTTLIRQLLRDIPEDIEVGLVSNMQQGRGELLQWIMLALDQEPGDAPYIELFQRFQNYLIDRYATGKRVVIIIDEAQNLSVEAIEELRMLSNINSDENELLQLIVVGQPQLRELLRRPELEQFAQRMTADFHISRMSASDVRKYIHHRLSVAGAQWRIFPDRTCDLICAASRGIPRLVNVLCDMCLVVGFSDERKVIEEPLLRETITAMRSRGVYEQFVMPPEEPTPLQHAQ